MLYVIDGRYGYRSYFFLGNCHWHFVPGFFVAWFSSVTIGSLFRVRSCKEIVVLFLKHPLVSPGFSFFIGKKSVHPTKAPAFWTLPISLFQELQLTKEKLAAEYPQLYEYVVNLDSMSYQMLFEREELHDFWKDPVRKGGEIIKNHRILWCGEPLPSFIASLAIHTCSRLQMDLSQARNFCMSFNNKGCHSTSCSCNFFHLCLCCGSGRHGFKDCERSQELLEEAQHFQKIFGVDPLHPLSKFGGEDLESILLKLVQNDIMPPRANADALVTSSSVEDVTDPSAVVEDPLLLWYTNDGWGAQRCPQRKHDATQQPFIGGYICLLFFLGAVFVFGVRKNDETNTFFFVFSQKTTPKRPPHSVVGTCHCQVSLKFLRWVEITKKEIYIYIYHLGKLDRVTTVYKLMWTNMIFYNFVHLISQIYRSCRSMLYETWSWLRYLDSTSTTWSIRLVALERRRSWKSWKKPRAKETVRPPQRSPRIVEVFYHRNGRWKRWLTGYGTWKGIDIAGWALGVFLFFFHFDSKKADFLQRVQVSSLIPSKSWWKMYIYIFFCLWQLWSQKDGCLKTFIRLFFTNLVFTHPELWLFFDENERDCSKGNEARGQGPGFSGMSRPSRRISSMEWALKP